MSPWAMQLRMHLKGAYTRYKKTGQGREDTQIIFRNLVKASDWETANEELTKIKGELGVVDTATEASEMVTQQLTFSASHRPHY